MAKELVKSGSSSSKRLLVKDADRLSTLPPETRSHILSLLPSTIDAARVGLLSKLLRSAFCSVSRLVFDYSEFPETENKPLSFADFIDQTIARHDDSDVKTLELWLWPVYDCNVPIKSEWVSFAVIHSVQKLVLYGKIKEKELPDNLFTCHTLVKLELAVEDLVFTSENFALPNLRKLKLKFLMLAGLSDTNLFPNLPSLRKVSMFYCYLETRRGISISSETLEEFIMCCPGIYNCVLRIQSPRLSNFIFINDDGENSTLDVHSRGLQFVISGQEGFVVSGNVNELIPPLIKVVKDLFKIGCVSLSHWLIEYLSMAPDMLEQATRCEFHVISRLEIEIWPIMDHLPVLMLLLSRCPNLFQLILVLKIQRRSARQLLSVDSLVEYGTMGGLRTVKLVDIENFAGDETELMLVRFLLANMMELCLMRIVLADFTAKDRRMLIYEILEYEKGCEFADVIFD